MFTLLRRRVALWLCPEFRVCDAGFFDLAAAKRSVIARRGHNRPDVSDHVAEKQRGADMAGAGGSGTLAIGHGERAVDIPQPLLGGACDV